MYTIIAVTETWAKSEFPDGLYASPGYNLLRDDRSDKRGGGVMLYIDKQVRLSQISLKSYSFGNFEFLCCKLHLINSKFVGIMCIYRLSYISYTGDLFFINVINKFLDLNIPYNIIIGDCLWLIGRILLVYKRLHLFLNCCIDHYLTQNARKSIKPNSDSLLDIILSADGTNI